VLLIPGTSSVEHLEENMAVAGVELDEQDLAELGNATQLGDPVAPPTNDLTGHRVASASRVAASAGA